MGHVDALAARAARNEAKDDNSITWVDGREYKLVSELSFDAVDAWGVNDKDAFVRAVLADPDEAEAFLAPKSLYGWADLNVVWNLVLHGRVSAEVTDAGESSASSRSSKKDGKRSRPTSNASTEPT